MWFILGMGEKPLPLFSAASEDEFGEEDRVVLPSMPVGVEVVEDYAMLRMSLKCHPLQLLRSDLAGPGLVTANELLTVKDGARVSTAGLVLCRQRPGSAKGVIFVALEDETGTVNVIVWPKFYEIFRRQVLTARLMRVSGKLQREGIVLHLIADYVENLSYLLDALSDEDNDRFDNVLAHADAVQSPNVG